MESLGPKGINFTYTDKREDLNAEVLGKYDALMIYANWDELLPEQENFVFVTGINSDSVFVPIIE